MNSMMNQIKPIAHFEPFMILYAVLSLLAKEQIGQFSTFCRLS